MEKKILIVDSIKQEAMLMAMTFEKHGYAVHTAANALCALRMFEENTYAAIVADYNMDGHNGSMLVRSIRKYENSEKKAPKSKIFLIDPGALEPDVRVDGIFYKAVTEDQINLMINEIEGG